MLEMFSTPLDVGSISRKHFASSNGTKSLIQSHYISWQTLFRNKPASTWGSSLGVRTSVRCLEWFSETVNLRTFYKSMTTVFRHTLNICSAVSLIYGNGLKAAHSRQDELPKRKCSLSFISKLNPCRKHPAQDKIQMILWTCRFGNHNK